MVADGKRSDVFVVSSPEDHREAMVPPVEGVAGGGTAYGWSETGVQDPSLLRGSIDPSKVHSSELVHVWCMPNTANVGPQDMPRMLETVSLGDFVFFNIASCS